MAVRFGWFICALFALATACVQSAEKLTLQPVSQNGTGKVVDGLRVTAKAVKQKYGPGESIMLHWTLDNLGDTSAALRFDSRARARGFFEFEMRAGGETRTLARETAAPAEARIRRLAPGGKTEQWIDLSGLDWKEKGLFSGEGSHELRLVYRGAEAGRAIRSGWVAFQVVPAGAPRLPDDPELAEKVETLIGRLGADDFNAREKAQADLLAIGRETLGALKHAAQNHNDPEVRLRCGKLVEQVRRQMYGMPPPPVIRPKPRPIIIVPQPRPRPRPRPQPIPQPQPEPWPVDDEF